MKAKQQRHESYYSTPQFDGWLRACDKRVWNGACPIGLPQANSAAQEWSFSADWPKCFTFNAAKQSCKASFKNGCG
jgi:hypothetical protein